MYICITDFRISGSYKSKGDSLTVKFYDGTRHTPETGKDNRNSQYSLAIDARPRKKNRLYHGAHTRPANFIFYFHTCAVAHSELHYTAYPISMKNSLLFAGSIQSTVIYFRCLMLFDFTLDLHVSMKRIREREIREREEEGERKKIYKPLNRFCAKYIGCNNRIIVVALVPNFVANDFFDL